jgi:hypothetical protein
LPILLAREAATRVERAAIMFVVKNIVPRKPSVMPNFLWKKTVTHELHMMSEIIPTSSVDTYSGIKPLAKESSPNRRHSCNSTAKLSGLM